MSPTRTRLQSNEIGSPSEVLRHYEDRILALWNELHVEPHGRASTELRREYQEVFAAYKRHQMFVRALSSGPTAS